MKASKKLGVLGAYDQQRMRYADEYAIVLPYVCDRHIALAELRLFRFWLSLCAKQPDMADNIAQVVMCISNALPESVDGISITKTLGRPIEQLVKRRFELYTRFFVDGRHVDDPFGLRAAALALSCQLCVHPPRVVLDYLEENTQRHFFAQIICAECAPA